MSVHVDRCTGTGPVPHVVGHGEDVITVTRAWPTAPDGSRGPGITVEGRDGAGRVRAGVIGPDQELVLAAPGHDPRLPALASATGTIVVHRYGRRAVLRRPDAYVKVLRPGRADQVADQSTRGRDLATGGGWSAPVVLSADADTVTTSVLPGVSLHELGRSATIAQWRALWAGFTDRWDSLVGRATTGLPWHTAEDEAAVLRRWVHLAVRYGALAPGLSSALSRRVDGVTSALVGGRAQALVPSHRDLHDKQVLADGDRWGLLDFDTVAAAEPALDLANLLVHVDLRRDQRVWSPEHAIHAAAAVREAARRSGVSDERMAVYAAATRIRLACLYAFRPAQRELALCWARGIVDNQ